VTPAAKLLLTLVVACTLPAAACGGGGGGAPTSPSGAPPTTTTGTMAISHFAIDLASSPFVSNIDLNAWPAHTFPPIHVFGNTYQGKVEPTLMFDMLKIGTPVYAPFDGTIRQVIDQPESCDTEMYFIDNNRDSQNSLSYDHVTPLDKFRAKGAAFKAGEQIGTIPAWQCTQKHGGIEMMLVSQATGTSTVRARCPLALLDPARKATLLAGIASVMDWWNALSPRSPYSASERANGLCPVEYVPL